jgi:excisionase family DNA binding protein
VQSTQNQTSTGNESYEQRERRDLLQRITDFYLRFGYVPMFFGEPGQAAPIFKRPERETPAYWNSEQAARYIGIHVETLRKMVRLGKFPRIPIGKDYRFTREKGITTEADSKRFSQF